MNDPSSMLLGDQCYLAMLAYSISAETKARNELFTASRRQKKDYKLKGLESRLSQYTHLVLLFVIDK
jgi:hypothetical protein